MHKAEPLFEVVFSRKTVFQNMDHEILKAPQMARSDKESSPHLSGISDLFMIDTAPATKLVTDKVSYYKRAFFFGFK